MKLGNLDKSRSPTEDIGAVIKAAIHRLHALAGPGPASVLDKVTKVVLVQSASRGGSTFVTEALRGFPELLHLRGEMTPLLTAAGLTAPWNGADSDFLDSCTPSTARLLDNQLAFDLTAEDEDLDDTEKKIRFTQALSWRLTAQWPEERFEVDEVGDALEHSLRHAGNLDDNGDTSRLSALYVTLLRELRRAHPAISPWYYDVRAELVRRFCPDVPMAAGPPSRCLIEEPPFIAIRPMRVPDADEIECKELVIKSPSNAFRLPFLRMIFPNAIMRIIHLTRDAPASIAGLIDGWLYRGFHSHWLPGELDIPGYTDAVGEDERQWWKFDLPPGWREWVSRPLVDVCAWQWERVHREILSMTSDRAFRRYESDLRTSWRTTRKVTEPRSNLRNGLVSRSLPCSRVDCAGSP